MSLPLATLLTLRCFLPRGFLLKIGHEKQTMTYGLYSGGTSVKQRQEAIVEFEKLMLEKEAEANVLPFSGDKR